MEPFRGELVPEAPSRLQGQGIAVMLLVWSSRSFRRAVVGLLLLPAQTVQPHNGGMLFLTIVPSCSTDIPEIPVMPMIVSVALRTKSQLLKYIPADSDVLGNTQDRRLRA